MVPLADYTLMSIMCYHVLVEHISIMAVVGAVIWGAYSLASVNTKLLHCAHTDVAQMTKVLFTVHGM